MSQTINTVNDSQSAQPTTLETSRGLRDKSPLDRESGTLPVFLRPQIRQTETTANSADVTANESQQPRKKRFSLSDLACCSSWLGRSRKDDKGTTRDTYLEAMIFPVVQPAVPNRASNAGDTVPSTFVDPLQTTTTLPIGPEDGYNFMQNQNSETRPTRSAVHDFAEPDVAPKPLKKRKSTRSINSARSYSLYPTVPSTGHTEVPPLPSVPRQT